MGVFKVTNFDGTWDNIETNHTCLANLFDDLRDTGAILCSKLRTRRGDTAGERVVTGRTGAIITTKSFATIEDATILFVEAD